MPEKKRKFELDNDNVSMSSGKMEFRPSKQKTIPKKIFPRYYTIIGFLVFMIFESVAIAKDLKPLHSVGFSHNHQKPFYVVIIDAGSTGSRVLAFAFHNSLISNNLILDNELFHEVKPGLSSFADNPSEVSTSLQILIGKAKSVIPQSEWSHTPIVLKATAGLRLLPSQKANAILENTKIFFKTCGFRVTDKSVSIMEGTDEGIFSWLTVNFLLYRFNSRSSENTVAALDLGGGSTQVTFAPDQENIKILSNYIHNISAFNLNMSLYTHSYLGMGLMAARRAILVPDDAVKNKNGIIEVRSECIYPNVTTTWNYRGEEYLIKGLVKDATKVFENQSYAGGEDIRPIVRLQNCLNLVNNYTNRITNKPLGIKKHEIFAFSYYFDRASEIGLIDPVNGGETTVDALHKATVKTCENPNTEPFMCLDLTYMYSLLRNRFDLEPSTMLHLYRKISGHEMSWALGSAFNVLQSEQANPTETKPAVF